MNKKKRALLIGDCGTAFTYMASALEEKEISAKLLTREAVSTYEKCKQLFESDADYDYVAISCLVKERQLSEMDEKEWHEWKMGIFDYLFDISKTLIKSMKNGRVLLIGSNAGRIPQKNCESNGAASAAAFMMAKTMAVEHAGKGITTYGLAIGTVADEDIVGLPAPRERFNGYLASQSPLTAKEVGRRATEILTEASDAENGHIFELDSALSCDYMREW